MRIGIITFHRAYNMGAVLQTYALQTYLKNKGYEVDIINYHINETKRLYHVFDYKKSDIKVVDYFKKNIRKMEINTFERNKLSFHKKYDYFINNVLKIHGLYSNIMDLRNMNTKYDVLICGSDQIWNSLLSGLNPIYFLDFGNESIKKISYAASVGVSEIDESEKQVFQRYLKNLDYISVRETDAKEILKDLTQKQIEVVIDPSQLLESKDYQNIITYPKIKQKYILFYVKKIKDEKIFNKAIKIAEKVSKLLNLPIIHNSENKIFSNEIKNIQYCGPEEILGYISNAEFVITNSFHATSFSLIFHKNFITIPHHKFSSRMNHLLTKYGLKNHLVDSSNKIKSIKDFNVNYKIVDKKICDFRKKSELYLKEAIEGPKIEEKNSYFETKDKISCYGCRTCENICPYKAISMKEDSEGFIYPVVDEKKCTNCGLCKSRCIYKNDKVINKNKKIITYAIYSKDDEIRKNSSSGGIFTELYNYFINNLGYVIGVKYDKNMNAVYSVASNIKECEEFRGSKYVRADNNDIYKVINKLIKNNKLVLVTGTPCFIAGLKSFLNYKEYENLYLVELLCHSNPSPKVFKKYKESLEKEYNSKILDIKFRSHKIDWHNSIFSVKFENGLEIDTFLRNNEYFKVFSRGLISRPSCYNCEFTFTNRVGDLQIGDFWGIDKITKNIDDNNGVSLVLLNTEKGNKLFNIIKSKCRSKKMTLDEAFLYNHKYPIDLKKERQEFLSRIDSEDITEILKPYKNVRNNKKICIIRKALRYAVPKNLRKIIKNLIFNK